MSTKRNVGGDLHRNALSYFGLLIMIGSAVLIVFSFLASLLFGQTSPYWGIFTYLVFPGILVFGFVVFLAGTRWEAGRRRKLNTDRALPYPTLDLNDRGQRKRFGWALVGGGMIMILLALTGYNGFLFTESVAFCGRTCHTVMKPEYTAYGYSPHARVACVDCHVGTGASWYVKSKLSGVRQVFAVAFHTYQRPIPVPIRDLRPARETCEECHWPQKFYGAKLLQMPHYRYDESNTAEQITLTVRTGGGSRTLGQNSGIHWHMIIDNTVTFGATDSQLQTVPWVHVRHSDGTTIEYVSPEYNASSSSALHKRRMDCMDCHNRPTHGFTPPDTAVDTSLYSNLIPASLPWIKRVSVEALIQPYSEEATARAQIRKNVMEFYQTRYPTIAQQRTADIDKAIATLIGIWERNVFPEMRVDWKTYADNIGHRNWPGCFRCHDGRHKSKEGKVLTMDCSRCHTMPERGPLAGLGNLPPTVESEWHPWDLASRHLAIAAHEKVLCSACHSAGFMPRKECKDCHK